MLVRAHVLARPRIVVPECGPNALLQIWQKNTIFDKKKAPKACVDLMAIENLV